jgi:hypothetical protein
MGIRHGIIAPIDYEFRRYTAFFKQEQIGLLSLAGGHFHIGGLLTNLTFRCEVDVL